MRPTSIARPVVYAASHLPLLKRLPVMKLVMIAEIALLAREHVVRLSPQERRRVVHLVRLGRIRRHLSDDERHELAALVAKMQPRLFFGNAVSRLSPVPIPGRLLYGSQRKRRGRG